MVVSKAPMGSETWYAGLIQTSTLMLSAAARSLGSKSVQLRFIICFLSTARHLHINLAIMQGINSDWNPVSVIVRVSCPLYRQSWPMLCYDWQVCVWGAGATKSCLDVVHLRVIDSETSTNKEQPLRAASGPGSKILSQQERRLFPLLEMFELRKHLDLDFHFSDFQVFKEQKEWRHAWYHDFVPD